jgi:RNA polymerase sigma-70 factor (ECF subfamily)
MTSIALDDERLLIAAAQAGDERAFRRLVEPYRTPLEVHAYRMLGSPHDAEDVVQDTLMRAWRSLDRFQARSSMHTWLYRIATNACLDELERRPRRPEPVAVQPFPDARLSEPVSAPIVDPAARYALREGMELALLAAIQTLPGRQRAILILRDVLGWSAPEVADLLDTTVAGVSSALQRARATVDAAMPPADAVSSVASDADERELLARYVDAWERTDIDGLVALLREDAELRMPPQRTIFGDVPIVQFFDFGCKLGLEIGNVALTPLFANGRPGVAMHAILPDGSREPHGILLFEVRADGVIGSLDAFIDAQLVRSFGL